MWSESRRVSFHMLLVMCKIQSFMQSCCILTCISCCSWKLEEFSCHLILWPDFWLRLSTPPVAESIPHLNCPNGSSPYSYCTAPRSVSASISFTGNFLHCRQTRGKTHPYNIIPCSEEEEREREREAGSAWEWVNEWKIKVWVWEDEKAIVT